MKTIYQLAKIARRLPRMTRKCVKALTDGVSKGYAPNRGTAPRKSLTDGMAQFERNRLAGLTQAALLFKQEVKARRIGAPAFRCALPHKQQRKLLAANDSSTAQKLLAGQPLAA